MRFPKYQWMQEEPINDSCGFCDVLYKTQNSESDAFQVMLDTNTITDNKFTSNPFDLITSDDFSFKLTFPKKTQLQLYIQTKIYIIEWNTASSTDITELDNVYYVKIGYNGADTSSGRKTKFLSFLNDIIDVNHGTISSLLTDTFTISDIPESSYLNNSYGFINSESTTAVSGNIGNNFYWNYNKINYALIGSTLQIRYQFEETLNNSQLTLLKFYYNSVSSTFGLNITINDGVYTPIVYTPTIGLEGVIEIEYIPSLTGTHTIELSLIDTEDIKSGFSLERILIQELILLSNLEIEDCYGNITSFEYDQEDLQDILDNIVDNVLRVKLIDNYPEVFRFIITDSADNTLTSRWYKVADKDDCTNGKLYSVKWTNGCNLGEIDYSALPFTNELLLSGVLLKSDTDLIDSVENITASGKKISIYKNTQSVYEFRMHPYLSDTFETILEGIFAHDTVTIDGIEYNTTDKVQVSELDLGVYTGRVDLYKDGTNLITKNCC